MIIDEIVSATLKSFKGNLALLTPDNFEKKFCLEAKKKGYKVDCCHKIDSYKKSLSSKLSKQLDKYPIKTVDEFVKLIVTKLELSIKNSDKHYGAELISLIKTLLKTISKLHNKEARSITDTHKNFDFTTKDQINMAKERWKNFNLEYNNLFLNDLDIYGKFSKDDFETMLKEIKVLLSQTGNEKILVEIQKLFTLSLLPSIAPAINDKIAKLNERLVKAPELLTSNSVINEITELIEQRIELDANYMNQRVGSLEDIIVLLLNKIGYFLESSGARVDEVEEIKNRLEKIHFKTMQPQTIKTELEKIHQNLSSNIDNHIKDIKSQQNELLDMQNRIDSLEQELKEAKREAGIDYLTKLYNKRALRDIFDEAENLYKKDKIDYAVIFIDIDYFKKINDNYGHSAGDIVLASVAKLLKLNCDNGDIVGRFGGEEFIILTKQKTLSQAIEHINDIREKIQKSTFIYKQTKIHLTLSGGVGLRSAQNSLNETIKVADNFVYMAKEAGRNQVFPKN